MSGGWGDVSTDVHREPFPTVAIATIDLLVVEGPDQGTRARLSPGVARIGTALGNQLRLTDRTVSRIHCELRRTKSTVRIVDAGSTNGVFADGLRVHDVELAPGSVFRIGATAIRVASQEEPTHVPISTRHEFGPVLGAGLAMRRVYAIMDRLAQSDATALILGETGTGKELVARAVHEASARARGPFVTVDCGAIAENLIESELFGHVRGAFSGAYSNREGLLSEAQGGTLFLDEVGELPLALQPKLLRVLEARTVRRVGENESRPVDVRILAATNRSLARAVNEGSFREDLYYRLAVVELELPPLRARREDLEILAQHFYERFAGAPAHLPDAVRSAVHARGWPGNVRELRNFIERTVTLAQPSAGEHGGVIPDGLLALMPVHLPLKEARSAWTEQFERLYVEALLRRTNGNVTHAAGIAGVHRRSLHRLMAAIGKRLPDASGPPDGDAED